MAEKYDLTPRVAPQLDRHIVFPLLEFLHERGLYPEADILKAKIELLNQTNMVDYAMDIHKFLYHSEDVPQEMVERRVEVVGRLKSSEERAAPLIAFLQNPNAYSEHCFRRCNNPPLDEISLSSQNPSLKRSSLRRLPGFQKNSPSTLSDRLVSRPI